MQDYYVRQQLPFFGPFQGTQFLPPFFPGQGPGFPGQGPGFPGQGPGFPGQGPGFPGQGPGVGGGPPSGPPPSFIPSQAAAQQSIGVLAVDPGAIRPCRFRFVYLWLDNRQQFWAWLIFIGRQSVAGWRWTGFNWVYFGLDLNRISSFICY
ncbi:MAG: transporter [Clostridiaceae bacterium]|nr:transporter [Clostridiaceae bacterium]